MEDNTTVVEPVMDAVETPTEVTSPVTDEVSSVENQISEETPSVDKEDVQISEKGEDVKLAPKSENRFQTMANRIKDLETQLAGNPKVLNSQQEMKSIEEWNSAYEQDPNARYDPQLAANYAHNQGELLKLRGIVLDESQKFNERYNKAVEIEQKAEIFNPNSEKYSQDFLDEFQDLVFNENMDPQKAYTRVEKLYNAASSKAQAQYKQSIDAKKSINRVSETPVVQSEPNIDKMSSTELKAYILSNGAK
jgi:hypothetical protein